MFVLLVNLGKENVYLQKIPKTCCKRKIDRFSFFLKEMFEKDDVDHINF